MKHQVLILAAAAALACTAHAQAGDPEAGAEKAAPCAACHGPDGNSANPEWPKLAGQHAEYTVRQLRAYQEGTRSDAMMAPMAANLSEQDMQDLAAYYAEQEGTRGEADPDLVELGEKIYRGGNLETGVSACIACHGPRGSGNGPAGWPKLAGQHAAYTRAQLRKYAEGERTSDMESMMQDIAARMSDEEIEAVASYIQGLQ